MIPRDFAYCRPTALQDAYDTFRSMSAANQETHYYAGGTEIITMSRLYSLHPQAVVDLKAIPECNVLERREGKLYFGASLTISQITEANLWPLLSEAAGRVADHSTRCKITLGGNFCGRIPYREAMLPFLLAEAELVIWGKDGLRRAPIRSVLDKYLRLEPGEFVVQAIVDEEYAKKPYMHEKRTRLDWVDYPLLTVSAINVDGGIRMAFSGICPFPFRSAAIEEALNERGASHGRRIDKALTLLPEPVVGDVHGLPEYRMFVFRNTVRDILIKLECDPDGRVP